MRMTGILRAVALNVKNHRHEITFDTRAQDLNEIKNLLDKPIAAEIKAYSPGRSKNANSYFHAMCRELAQLQRPPVTEAYMKNLMIHRYGQLEYVGDDPMIYQSNAPIEYMMELEDFHTYPAPGGDDRITYYRVYKRTHLYDRREMSILIDGTVEECKRLGIPTKTQEELFKLLERWGNAQEA